MKLFIGLRLSLVVAVAFVAACNDQPTAPVPSELVLVQAPSTVGAPGWPLMDTLKVQAVDPDGHPRPGVQVFWDIREGGGRITPIGDTTDVDGVAAAIWTLGHLPGPNRVLASLLDDASVEFQSNGEAFRVDRLAAGWGIGCGLVRGALWCWTYPWGESPPASRDTMFGSESRGPVLVDDSHDFIDLAVSSTTACGLDHQLVAWCAGGSPQPQFAVVAGLPPVRQIVGAGDNFIVGAYCGLSASDSTAWCWQFGMPAAQVPGSPRFTGVWMEDIPFAGPGAFNFTACGLRVDSTAACWGAGPLGDGSTAASATPVVVGGGHKFVELAVGTQFACGQTSAGEVWCWGKDYRYGQGPNFPDILLPALAATGAYGIAADEHLTAMIGGGSGLSSWSGAGVEPTPQFEIKGFTGLPVERFAGNNNHACMQLVDGEVYCWDIFWDHSSLVPFDSYSPVQPVRSLPLSGSRR